MKRKPLGTEAGFTLLEVLLAFGVLGLVSAGWIGLSHRRAALAQAALRQTVAERSAGVLLERARAGQEGWTAGTRPIELSAAAGRELPQARAEVVTAPVRPGLWSVAARVSWAGPRTRRGEGARRRVALETWVAQPAGQEKAPR